jgi:hypothetical protein
MGYTENYIVGMVHRALVNPKELYAKEFLNYKGKTTDTGVLYNEIVAMAVYENLERLESILSIRRDSSYKTIAHNGVITNTNSGRNEEISAKEIFNQQRSNSKNAPYKLGEILDYQTPLKNSRKDEAGKIDLLLYSKNILYILEFKKEESEESLLRAILEGYTYSRIVDHEKLIRDFNRPKGTEIKSAPLIFKNSEGYKHLNQSRPWLKNLIFAMKQDIFVVEKNASGDYIISKEIYY